MQHQQATQASAHYDANADTKLVKAAYEFNLSYATQFAASSGGGSSGGAGGSSDAAVVQPPDAPAEPPPPPPAPEANVESHVLPPVAVPELIAQVESLGFKRGSARGNGDCYR